MDMDVACVSAQHALPRPQRGGNNRQIGLRCAHKEMHGSIRCVTEQTNLRGGLGAVGVLPIAGGLVKIGPLHKVQYGGGCALAIVTFKTKHILNSLPISMYAAGVAVIITL